MEAHRWSRTRCYHPAGLSRSAAYQVSHHPDDRKAWNRLKEPARFHRRYGYLRFHYLLRKEGVVVNTKQTDRLYRAEGHPVPQRRGRTRFKRERREQTRGF